jgi:hypothetical protein
MSFTGWRKDSIIHEWALLMKKGLSNSWMSFTGWRKHPIMNEWSLLDEERTQ